MVRNAAEDGLLGPYRTASRHTRRYRDFVLRVATGVHWHSRDCWPAPRALLAARLSEHPQQLPPSPGGLGSEVFVGSNLYGLGQPIRYFGKVGKLSRQFSRKLSRGKTPLPVPSMQAGRIHAGLAAQAEYILQGDKGKLGCRGLRRADECPMNPIIAASKIRLRIAPLMIGRPGMEPANRRVVVVRSGINDLAGGAMRQIHVRALVAKAELQDGKPWYLQALPQSVNLRRDVAQILREEWQAPQRL